MSYKSEKKSEIWEISSTFFRNTRTNSEFWKKSGFWEKIGILRKKSEIPRNVLKVRIQKNSIKSEKKSEKLKYGKKVRIMKKVRIPRSHKSYNIEKINLNSEKKSRF